MRNFFQKFDLALGLLRNPILHPKFCLTQNAKFCATVFFTRLKYFFKKYFNAAITIGGNVDPILCILFFAKNFLCKELSLPKFSLFAKILCLLPSIVKANVSVRKRLHILHTEYSKVQLRNKLVSLFRKYFPYPKIICTKAGCSQLCLFISRYQIFK